MNLNWKFDKTSLQVLLSGAATITTYLCGGWDSALKILVMFIIADYITGVLCAFANKELSSKVGRIGIIKKVGYLVIVTVAVGLDRIAGDTGLFRNPVIYFFVANEGISILENWGEMGLPIPKPLLERLIQLKETVVEKGLSINTEKDVTKNGNKESTTNE